MRLKYLLITVTALCLWISCGEKPKKIPPVQQEILPTQVATTEILIEKIITKRNKQIAKLPLLSKNEANLLYETYKKENDSLVLEIEQLEQNTLNNYVSFYDEQGKDLVLPDSVKQKATLLDRAGLEFWEIGEGMTEIRTKPDFYLQIFKDYVTDDYKEFISINAKEDEQLYAADAGLSISFHELGKRVLVWENFIAQYPQSKLFPHVKDIYENYQWDYLFGLDNTPTMEYADMKIYPENKTEFKQFIRANPNSYTSFLVKMVLDNKAPIDSLRAKIQNERDGYIY